MAIPGRAASDVAYQPSGFCPRCGYAVDAGTCPECGAAVASPARISPRSRRARLRRLAIALGVLGAAGVGGYCVGTSLAVQVVPGFVLSRLEYIPGPIARWAEIVLYEQEQRRWAREERRALRQRDQIEAELAHGTGSVWAGLYAQDEYFGDAHIAVAPVAGFVYLSRGGGCFGGSGFRWDRGTVAELGRAAVGLTAATDRSVHPIIPADQHWECVVWMGRRYLVPSDALEQFVIDINNGDKFGVFSGIDLVHRNDLESGEPTAPTMPRCRVLFEPRWIAAAITSIDRAVLDPASGGAVCELALTLDRGLASGLGAGMNLRLVRDGPTIDASVIDASADRAFARMIVLCDDDNWAVFALPRVGDWLWTPCEIATPAVE